MGLERIVGLGLPVTRQSGGYFTLKKGKDVAFSDLVIAIFTPIGGRPMKRDFGSGLSTLLFDPNDKTAIGVINKVIRDAAQKWCPYVSVQQVDVAQNGRYMYLRIVFSLTDDRTPVERVVTVPFDQPAAQINSAEIVRY